MASSGNLAHVYFTSLPGQASEDEIEACYPGLVAGLAQHPGIGVLIVRSTEGHVLALGADGRLDLATGQLDGTDPLEVYGPRAADAVRRLAAFRDVRRRHAAGCTGPRHG